MTAVKMMPSSLRSFAKEVPSSALEITEFEDVRKSAIQYHVGQRAGFVAHNQIVGNVPSRLCPVQVFAERIPLFLGGYHINRKVFEKGIWIARDGLKVACATKIHERSGSSRTRLLFLRCIHHEFFCIQSLPWHEMLRKADGNESWLVN